MEGKSGTGLRLLCGYVYEIGTEADAGAGLIAVIIPVAVGLLGVNGVAGLLAGNTVTGFVLAVMMAQLRRSMG